MDKEKIFEKFSASGVASPSSNKGVGHHFDISKGTMDEKLELVRAVIEEIGEGNSFLVVTTKDQAKNVMIGLETVGVDLMA